MFVLVKRPASPKEENSKNYVTSITLEVLKKMGIFASYDISINKIVSPLL
jgi:hypothetical protein